MQLPSKGPLQALQHSVPQTFQQATADPRLRQRLLDTHRQVWVSLLWDHFSFFLGSGAHKIVCAPQVFISLVLCKFWQLYGGVNGDLFQKDLCHTQVCCTQSPCLCGSPLLTCTLAGDTQTQVCPTLCGASGPWCTQDLFEPSECLWREWGLF